MLKNMFSFIKGLLKELGNVQRPLVTLFKAEFEKTETI